MQGWTKVLACAAMVAPAPGMALAADAGYPAKPVRVVVPFAPGGGTDIVARIMAQRATEVLKQPVVVDNRGGAGGLVGMEIAVRAVPDGYTLCVVTASIGTTAAMYRLPYDPVSDFVPISMLGETGYVLTVHPTLPVRTTQELVAHAKANPGKITYGSSGAGGTAHLAGELFDLMAGTRMTHVPYKSTGPALTDLLAGQIHMIYGSGPVVGPHAGSGRLRLVAITSVKRSRALPDVPTLAESGLPGYEAITWYGLVGPKGIAPGIVTRWVTVLREALETREMKDRFQLDGLEAPEAGPSYLGQVIRRDIARWKDVVVRAKLKPAG